MPDRLDEQIRALVVELVEASPPPPPVSDVLERARRPRTTPTLRSGPVRLVATALGVLALGTLAFLVGRSVLPGPPPEVIQPPITEGAPAPEARFSTEDLGEEVRLHPSSEEVTPDVPPDTLVGEVVAVGRIEGTDVEVFTWQTREDSLEGSCLQVVEPQPRNTACSAGPGPATDTSTPLTFPRSGESTDEVSQTIVVWEAPEGTSVVSLEAREIRLWQRPVGGVAAFVLGEDASSPAILKAWSLQGDLLASVGASLQAPVDSAPEWCPVTVLGGIAFTPLSEAPEGPPSVYDEVWYGTPQLWTMINPQGEVNSKRWLDGDTTFWWSENYSPEDPGEITVTAQHLDGTAPTVQVSEQAGSGFNPFMLMSTDESVTMIGIELPEPGCWELTAEYKGSTLSYVIWTDDD